jgi:hypothetical protein
MEKNNTNSTRTVLAHTLYPSTSAMGSFGFVRPLAEIIDEKLVELTEENFCSTMKVFITSHYDELEKRFTNQEIFKLEINISERMSENIDPMLACKYVSTSKFAEPLKPKEFFEIIDAPLPDPNIRIVDIKENFPGTRYIFVDNGNSVFGPFKWSAIADSANVIKLEFVDGPLPGVKLVQYQIYKIDRSATQRYSTSNSNGGNIRTILQGLSITSGSEFHDYASDDEILKYCTKIAAENNVKVVEKSRMDSLVTYLLKIPKNNYPLIKQRILRLPEIAASVADVQSTIEDNFSTYLNSENGKNIVATYVEKNQSRFLDTLKKERESELNALLEGKRDEIKLTESRLKELTENKISLSVQVEAIRNATKQEAVLDTARARADSQLREKKQELNDIETVITEKRALADGLLKLENIQRKIEAAEQNQKYHWKKEIDLKSAIDDLQSQLNTTEDALRKKLTELKPFVEAINGSFSISDVAQSEISVKAVDYRLDDMLVVRQRAVIDAIKNKLSKRGRPTSDWQLANLLISTQQSFISFLAGLPGVGKTSLARLLAELQDIRPRMREVAVARGWTSQKDLIGFFNPLTSRFQPANTGLYSFLMPLSTEAVDQSQAMAYILLDEANLSPIEHYWSSFMGMTDGEGERTLSLGQDKIQIASCLRFIATINYDSTTEPLSPRIVDRAPIIFIEPTDFETTVNDPIMETDNHPLPISAMQMHELFGNDTVIPEFEPAEKITFEKIKRILSDSDSSLGRPVTISPRKEIAIRHYCSKARGVMNAENDFLALDVAVLQHVLPLVRGDGARFAKRLELLRRELDATGLSKSSKFVAKIVAFGEVDLHTYDFFCW